MTKKNTILSIELINKDHYSIEIERKEDRVNILLVEKMKRLENGFWSGPKKGRNSSPMDKHAHPPKKEAGIKGTMDLARKLEHITRFEKESRKKDSRH